MKTLLFIPLLLIAAVQCLPVFAQQTTTDKIEGICKGTSLCQVKQSACHDENVVYHISKKAANLYTVQANKIVNGNEEDMGTFDVTYDETKQTLSFQMKDKQGRNASWLFRIDGIQIHGTLTINENTLFRIIELKKV